MSDKTATERLRELLDERGVEYDRAATINGGTVATFWYDRGGNSCSAIEGADDIPDDIPDGKVCMQVYVTPEQAIAATLGREQQSDPVWEQWYEGLRHDEIKTIGDAVEQLMYESIKNGGYMGPNGNTYGGVDEGEVATLGFINDWIEKFEVTLGRGTCEIYRVGNTRDIRRCSACGKQMHFDHPLDRDCLHYCPNCGREVVDE